MERNNNNISSFQFSTISFFLVSTLFVGIGITNIFVLNKQDSWLVSILSMILSILPLIILLFVVNYEPNKDIFEKMTSLFGKIIGNIINIVLVMFVILILVAVITSTTSFATTMYLTKTPYIFIIGIFVAIAVYAVIKGIETIGRLSEILFFISLIILIIITLSLIPIFRFDELKPILTKGFTPIFKNSFVYMAYSLTPLLLLTVIPKGTIVDGKRFYLKFFGIVFIALSHLFSVFFIIPGVYSAKLTEIFRFPAYYVLRKISIGGIIDNVENFLSAHWFFDNFILIVMCLHFFNKYLKSTFKIKKEKYINIAVALVGLATIILSNLIFQNPFSLTEFMKKYFSLYISLPIIVIFSITSILIFLKRKKSN